MSEKKGDLRLQMLCTENPVTGVTTWNAQIEIRMIGGWVHWDNWAREQPRNFSRLDWPNTFYSARDVKEVEGVGCEMLRAVRAFVPGRVPDTYYVTENDPRV